MINQQAGDNATIIGQIDTVNTLNIVTSRSSVGIPFLVPPLTTDHFVDRPEVTQELKRQLLAASSGQSGTLVISAIQGLGGIGKTVLAQALAHDREVQKRFCNGILWAKLGQEPDVLSLLQGWIEALEDNGDKSTKKDPSAYLNKLLHDKAVLLVIDDGWSVEDIEPFLVGSDKCQAIITTRRADVAEDVHAQLYSLNLMNEEQSLMLLSNRIGRELEEKEKETAKELAKLVGYLPIALDLAAARVARGKSWSELNSALTAEIARLEVLESARRRIKKETRLEASFNLSLDALRKDFPDHWSNFVWLGVLPKDVSIAAPMVTTLWEVDVSVAADRLELLWDDALLLSGVPVTIGEQEWPTYHIHDLLHDLAINLLTKKESPGLGLNVPEAHSILLKRYQRKTENGLWHTLDDEYALRYLAYHLKKAKQNDILFKLLLESPYWMEAKFDYFRGDFAYLSDIKLALNEFKDRLNSNQISIFFQLHMARQVITERAKFYNDTDLITLVWLGKKEEAIDHAYLRPGPLDRINSLFKIYDALCEKEEADHNLVYSIDKIARAFNNIEFRVEVFLKLAKIFAPLDFQKTSNYLDESKQIVDSLKLKKDRLIVKLAATLAELKIIVWAENEILSIKKDVYQVKAQCQLASIYIRRSLIKEAECKFKLAKTKAFSIESTRKKDKNRALHYLALALTNVERFIEAEEIIQKISPSKYKNLSLVKLVTALAKSGHFDKAKRKINELNSSLRDKNIGLARISEEYAKAKRFQEARETIELIDGTKVKANALNKLASIYAKYGETDKLNQISLESKQLSQLQKRPIVYLKILNRLGVTLVEENMIEKAEDVFLEVEQITQIHLMNKNNFDYSIALTELAIALAKAGFKDKSKVVFIKAEKVTYTLEHNNPIFIFRALNYLAIGLAQVHFKKEAEEILQKVEKLAYSINENYLIDRCIALCELSVSLARVRFIEKSKAAFQEVKIIIKGLKTNKKSSDCFPMMSELVVILSQYEYFSEAEEVLKIIKDDKLSYTRGLHQLAIDLKQAGKTSESQDINVLMSKNYKDLFQEASNVYFAFSMIDKNYVRAFKQNKINGINNFFEIIYYWCFLDNKEQNLPKNFVIDLIHIAAWSDPYWMKIDKLIFD